MRYLVLFIAITLTVSACGPGVTDAMFPIVGKYYYSDAGGANKTIVFLSDYKHSKIVVGARVDRYVIIGSSIFVARRPDVIQETNPITTKISDTCEHLIININTGDVRKITNTASFPPADNLRCQPKFYNDFDPTSPE